jgi:hypothetical protein
MSSSSLIGLITPSKTKVNQEQVEFDVYDPWTGIFKYNAEMPSSIYETQFPNGIEDHALVFLAGTLHDRPIMQDFLGTINESDSLFKVYEFKEVPGVPILPTGFQEHVANSYGALVLTTGAAEEGIYNLHSGGTTFEVVTEEDDMYGDEEDDVGRQEDWFATAGGTQEEEQEDWLTEASGTQIEHKHEIHLTQEEAAGTVCDEQQQPSQ